MNLNNAACIGNLKRVQELVEQADMEQLDLHGGSTPLILASQYGRLEVVRYLLEQGSDREKADHVGWTSFHYAANRGHLETAKLLMIYGADFDLNARSISGKLPIDFAHKEEIQTGHPRRAKTPHGRSAWQASH